MASGTRGDLAQAARPLDRDRLVRGRAGTRENAIGMGEATGDLSLIGQGHLEALQRERPAAAIEPGGSA